MNKKSDVHEHVSTKQVDHIAHLAHIPISADEAVALSSSFDETLGVIENLSSVDVSKLEPTHQVTGLTNVLREDIVTPERMFSQKEALKNASSTHEGYFMVAKILNNDE